jgi:hypothetical protein
MSTYDTILQMKKMVSNLDRWIEKAIAYADTKKFDPNVLVGARLAPDMYAFARQVQGACDSAKFAAARLTAKEAPKHADTETTMTELRERCKTVIAYLDGFKASDFEGADKRQIVVPYIEGKFAYGSDYLCQQALPNFFFHVTMAYAILRHNGVDVGKRDYIGAATLHDLK